MIIGVMVRTFISKYDSCSFICHGTSKWPFQFLNQLSCHLLLVIILPA